MLLRHHHTALFEVRVTDNRHVSATKQFILSNNIIVNASLSSENQTSASWWYGFCKSSGKQDCHPFQTFISDWLKWPGSSASESDIHCHPCREIRPFRLTMLISFKVSDTISLARQITLLLQEFNMGDTLKQFLSCIAKPFTSWDLQGHSSRWSG